MIRTGVVVLCMVAVLAFWPASAVAQGGNIEEIRQYFELRDTISLMNLEIKRALAPDSRSPLLSESDADNRLSNFVSFIQGRIDNFSQSDTPLKYHYVKKLNVIFAETRQLHAALSQKLKTVLPGTRIIPAPTPVASEAISEELKVQPKPFFDSIGMRTLAPGKTGSHATATDLTRPHYDLVKTPVHRPVVQPARVTTTPEGTVSKTPAVSAVSATEKVAVPAIPVKTTEKAKPQQTAAAVKPGVQVVPPPQTSDTAKLAMVVDKPRVTEPAKPAEIKSAPAEQSVKPVEPAKIAEPAKVIEPVKATGPVKAVEPDKPAEPVKAVEPLKPVVTVEKPAPVVPPGTGVMRPLAIMIENHNQSRPQSGLDHADVVYEMPVEGGITRFMAIYTRAPGLIGPVRSCREYFVDRALEIDALYVHCGGSPAGYNYISKTKINSIDEIKWGDPFFRDKTRKAPHNLYGNGKDVYEFMSAKVGMRLATAPVLLKYGQRVSSVPTEPVLSAKIRYHGNYSLEVKYEDGAWQRYMNDILHIDRETKKPLRASAVVIQVAAMKTVDAVGRQEISFIGSGTAWILEKGQRTKVTWHKETPKSLTVYKDSVGQEYLFPKDLQVWVQVVSPIHKLFFNGKEEEKPATVAGNPAAAANASSPAAIPAVSAPAVASSTTDSGKQG